MPVSLHHGAKTPAYLGDIARIDAHHRRLSMEDLFALTVRSQLLGSLERKWEVAGVWKIYPVELQDRARLHFPYTYYHVESVLQKMLKRQDHPLLIVSISIYNNIQYGISSTTPTIYKITSQNYLRSRPSKQLWPCSPYLQAWTSACTYNMDQTRSMAPSLIYTVRFSQSADWYV